MFGKLVVLSFLLASDGQRGPVKGQGTWETTLQGRDLDGNPATFEAYYDTDLDISWLATSKMVGPLDWRDANIFVTALNVHGVTGWRLPKARPVNAAGFNLELSVDATTDRGTASTTTNGSGGGWRDRSGVPVSELGHLYYVTLGNRGVCDPSLSWCTAQRGWGLLNTGPFFNLEPEVFWSGTSVGTGHFALGFFFGLGTQGTVDQVIGFNIAWPVHDGDVGLLRRESISSRGSP
jgi:hypothetical protein